ncbi:NAD(P)/FAD-dependent oxidoreductase [Corynebacterium sp. A21]|uniref:NAD(P)/FAD-dependent oxidoreductase n=1 Tax=Corynebacterium sp. A21 TaxID=3457318 RepID=UPI003FD0E98C
MLDKIEGKDASLWVASTPSTDYPKLEDDSTVYDLAIVGGGITGIVAAYAAQQRGLKTVLIEKARLAEWTTGGTTAKLTSQHYLIYDYLISHHGQAIAQAFADANQRGIDRVESISTELDIDCEFSRRDAYVYSQREDRLDELKAEVESAVSLGLPASLEMEIDLPLEITGAVKFSRQAQFHPRKFLLPIAQHFLAHGGVIYEQTKATGITPGEPNVITTKAGDIKAKQVLQASGEPFWKNDIFDGFMWLKMSYALAVQLAEGSAYPEGMYVTTDDPMRTMRTATSEGKPVLIFGGESHEYDENTFDADKHHQTLITDVRQKFDVNKVLYRWLAGDYMPYDRMPYIGAMPGYPSVHVITGYRAWGLAWAMSAAEAVINDIAGTPEEWVKPFSLDRLSVPIPESEKVPNF